MADYNTTKRIESVNKMVKAQKELKQRNKDYADLEERYNALRTMNDEQDRIIHDLLARDDKECLYVTINNDYVTSIVELQAYHTYLPLQEINGIEWNKLMQFMKTPLYAKIPFIKLNGRLLELDKAQYNKFIGGLI